MLIGVDASRVTRARRTGTENYSLHVLQRLLEQDRSNRYRLYFSQAPAADLLPQRADIERRIISLPRLWTHLGLSREMIRAAPDVLFVPSHVLPLVSARRSVVVVYDVGHRFFPRAHRLGEWLYLEGAIRRHVRVATEIITISEASKQDLVRLFHADPSRISVAYPAVDAEFKPPSAAAVRDVRNRYGLARPYVLHVGTIKPRKNLPRLVQAFAAGPLPADTELVLAGALGPGEAALRRTIHAAGVDERVRILSFVREEDLPALYGGSACTVLVSLHEGFGMPALEALACGAPLVASNRSSLPEFVAKVGLLVNPLDVRAIGEAVGRVVGDPTMARVLREDGPHRAAQFTWEEAARVTQTVLNRAAQ